IGDEEAPADGLVPRALQARQAHGGGELPIQPGLQGAATVGSDVQPEAVVLGDESICRESIAHRRAGANSLPAACLPAADAARAKANDDDRGDERARARPLSS